MSELTIVMYHYIRPLAETEFPRLNALELSAFRRQLDFLEENYTVISSEEIVRSIKKDKKLPDKACWLTFDDGYKDHFVYVLPELIKRNIHGAFFPPRKAIECDVMLDVNSIHHILARSDDIKYLIFELNKECLSCGLKQDFLDNLYVQFALANRWDNADVIYFKRMLQHAIPEAPRKHITSKLFKKYVGSSEKEFSKKLYMSVDEIKYLVNSGMYVGSHGSSHYWLDKISIESQRIDVGDSLEFLGQVGAQTVDWIMCYPWGAYNSDTLRVLGEFGAIAGITTEVRRANLALDDRLLLPRFNTNDFPQ